MDLVSKVVSRVRISAAQITVLTILLAKSQDPSSRPSNPTRTTPTTEKHAHLLLDGHPNLRSLVLKPRGTQAKQI